MKPLDITVGFIIAAVLIAVALYFAWRQRITLQVLRTDPKLDRDQRRYLFKQCWRRLFGSLLLAVLACMLVGSLFLDYQPLQKAPEEVPAAELEAAKKALGFLSSYTMAMLMLVMAILVLAVFDFWATARYGVQQRKQLVREHQELLEAELAQYKYRRPDLN